MPNEVKSPFNDFILVPEFIIEKILDQAIKFLNIDYQQIITDFNNEKLSFLYILTHGTGIQRLDIFEQAKKIFINDPTVKEKKKIDIHLGYPQLVEGAISVAIVNSGEQHGQNTLGVDGHSNDYQDFDYSSDASQEEMEEATGWRNTYGRRYNAAYQIIICGNNTNETVIVYTILKALIISLEGTGHISAFGFQNCKISSSDVTIKNQDLTKNLYGKSITFNFEYEFRVPDTHRQKYINGMIFKGVLENL